MRYLWSVPRVLCDGCEVPMRVDFLTITSSDRESIAVSLVCPETTECDGMPIAMTLTAGVEE